MTTTAPVDWRHWLDRWDEQQRGFLPHREERFAAMFDVVAKTALQQAADPADAEFTALDLACGPGSLSARLLHRFPKARVVAVDLDPVLLRLGEGALGDAEGRLHWASANLMTDAVPDILAAAGVSTVDAVLATTALHWLPAGRLAALYAELAGVLRSGGVFVNGDNIPYRAGSATFERLAQQRREADSAAARAAGVDGWDEWWAAIAEQPGIPELIEERTRRFSTISRDAPEPPVDFHLAALRAAGFAEADVAWQDWDDRVIAAIR